MCAWPMRVCMCMHARFVMPVSFFTAPTYQPVSVDLVAKDQSTNVSQPTALVFAGNPSDSFVTQIVDPSAWFARIRFNAPLPANATVLVGQVPCLPEDVRANVTAASRPLVGGATWKNGVAATKFQDRFVLHPPVLPARILVACRVIATALTDVLCALPPNMTNSLWRMYFGWGRNFPDGSVALQLSSQLIPVPLFAASGGNPLTLSYPLPHFDNATAYHFSVRGDPPSRAVPGGWPGSLDPSDPALQDSYDPTQSARSQTGDPILRAVREQPDPIYIPGVFTPVLSSLQTYLGYARTHKQESQCWHRRQMTSMILCFCFGC
jgi:hypothetical protein